MTRPLAVARTARAPARTPTHGGPSAMAYVHAQCIVHRDLKSFNVLIGSGGIPKLCDFGLSKKSIAGGGSGMQEQSASNTIGSVFWSAPEILRGENYTEKVDVYSYGVFLWELVSQRLPQPPNVANKHALFVAAIEGKRGLMPNQKFHMYNFCE